jgi:hypothetical protein
MRFQIQQSERLCNEVINFCIHVQQCTKFVFSEVKHVVFKSTDDGWTFRWASTRCSSLLHQNGNTCQPLLTLSSVSVWFILIYGLASCLFVDFGDT